MTSPLYLGGESASAIARAHGAATAGCGPPRGKARRTKRTNTKDARAPVAKRTDIRTAGVWSTTAPPTGITRARGQAAARSSGRWGFPNKTPPAPPNAQHALPCDLWVAEAVRECGRSAAGRCVGETQRGLCAPCPSLNRRGTCRALPVPSETPPPTGQQGPTRYRSTTRRSDAAPSLRPP